MSKSDQVMGVMAEALRWSYEMFLARDQMNAKVHCAPVRLSPVTERVKQALDMYEADTKALQTQRVEKEKCVSCDVHKDCCGQPCEKHS